VYTPQFRKILILSQTFLIVVFVTFSSPEAAAKDAVDNAKLYEMLGHRAHTVMKDQHARLRKILEGFLVGDWEKIERPVTRIIQDINRIESKYKAPPGKEEALWTALQEMGRNAKLLKRRAQERNFSESYDYFTAITLKCIECHQIQRKWGRLGETSEVTWAEHPVESGGSGAKEIAATTATDQTAEITTTSDLDGALEAVISSPDLGLTDTEIIDSEYGEAQVSLEY
jgi:hypothetical protein